MIQLNHLDRSNTLDASYKPLIQVAYCVIIVVAAVNASGPVVVVELIGLVAV